MAFNPTTTRTTNTAAIATPTWVICWNSITPPTWATILTYVAMPPQPTNSTSNPTANLGPGQEFLASRPHVMRQTAHSAENPRSRSRSAQCMFEDGTTGRASTAAYFAQNVNPYEQRSTNELPQNEVLRVPAAYACQQLNICPNVDCPFFYNNIFPTSCLYISDINGGPLRVNYNWLLSFFRRYPGFNNLHINTTCTGAIACFNSDYHTTFVKLSLDGFWPCPRYMLKVTLADIRIYEYMYLPDFTPENFFLYF